MCEFNMAINSYETELTIKCPVAAAPNSEEMACTLVLMTVKALCKGATKGLEMARAFFNCINLYHGLKLSPFPVTIILSC